MNLVNEYVYEGDPILINFPEWNSDDLPVCIHKGCGDSYLPSSTVLSKTSTLGVYSLDSDILCDGSCIRIHRTTGYPEGSTFPPPYFSPPYTDTNFYEELDIYIKLKPIDGEQGDDGAPGPPGSPGYQGPPGVSGYSIKGWDGDDGDPGRDGDAIYGWSK